jgi:hypothetical protein
MFVPNRDTAHVLDICLSNLLRELTSYAVLGIPLVTVDVEQPKDPVHHLDAQAPWGGFEDGGWQNSKLDM